MWHPDELLKPIAENAWQTWPIREFGAGIPHHFRPISSISSTLHFNWFNVHPYLPALSAWKSRGCKLWVSHVFSKSRVPYLMATNSSWVELYPNFRGQSTLVEGSVSIFFLVNSVLLIIYSSQTEIWKWMEMTWNDYILENNYENKLLQQSPACRHCVRMEGRAFCSMNGAFDGQLTILLHCWCLLGGPRFKCYPCIFSQVSGPSNSAFSLLTSCSLSFKATVESCENFFLGLILQI